MAIDITSPRSRRSLITAALGGVAAAAAATLAGAQRVLAAGDDGKVIHVGDQLLDVRTPTFLQNPFHRHIGHVLVASGSGATNGLTGYSTSGKAVIGQSNAEGWGVFGQSQVGTGVHGVSGAISYSKHYPAAIVGEVERTVGVSVVGINYAASGIAQGIQGETHSPTGWATIGWAAQGGTALVGVSGPNVPSSRVPADTGVYGYAEHGRGVVADGPVSQLRLVPASGPHPASGKAGDLFMDHANRLWLCKGGTDWHQLA